MNFKIGDTVQYTVWDGEEGRGYGWSLNTKTTKIASILYKMENGDMMEGKNLVRIPSKEPTKETQVESKSDMPKKE